MKNLLFTSLVLFLLKDIVVSGLRFKLKAGSKKCIQDEANKDVIARGEYEAVSIPDVETSILVRDMKRHILFQKQAIDKGKFAFTTEGFEVFEVCFESRVKTESNIEQEIYLNIKHGIEAKDMDSLAKAQKLQPIEAELKKLEGLADEIVQDFTKMHDKSSSMRNINESTHTRVLYLSIFSMVILIGFACWQVLYLRRYFKSKKLIE